VLNLMTCAKTSPSKTVRRVAATYFGSLKADASEMGNPQIAIDVCGVRPVAIEVEEQDEAQEAGPVDFGFIKGAEGSE
jgi:hypothetical protein